MTQKNGNRPQTNKKRIRTPIKNLTHSNWTTVNCHLSHENLIYQFPNITFCKWCLCIHSSNMLFRLPIDIGSNAVNDQAIRKLLLGYYPTVTRFREVWEIVNCRWITEWRDCVLHCYWDQWDQYKKNICLNCRT